MMTKLREYSKIFIIIVAVAFIALMVFEWGMDYTGLSMRQNVVGKVNGEELTYERFSELYQRVYENERARRDQEITEAQLENLRDQVWEQFVQMVLFEEQIRELGIAVSDSEIVYQIKNYPLEEIRNNPAFQTNGTFDWNKYYASFSNPEMPWTQIEQFYREQLPFQKLQNLITASVRVSDTEVEQEFIGNNLKARVSYLEIPFAGFRDRDIPITEDEKRKYYQNNIDEFQQEEMRNLSYVLFPLTPSPADSARIFDEFTEIRNRLENGEDFNDLAVEYSEDPAKATNQGRYDFFERGTMVKPFEEAAFGGRVGELVGPVKTQFGYHLINIEDKRVEDGTEQVKVSHILLKIEPGPSTRERQEMGAALFAEDARTEGFEPTAEASDLNIQTTGNISKTTGFIPVFGSNPEIINFAFRNEPGEISDVIFTDQGYAVFKVTDIKEAGPRPFDEVQSLVESRIKLEKQKDLARDFAANIEDKITDDLPFDDVVAADTTRIIRSGSTPLFSLKGNVPGIGYDPAFNGTAFSLSENETSDMIETNRGLYWQRLLEKTTFDSLAYQAQKESLRQRLLAQKRNQVFTDWYNFLKEEAEIVDNRAMFNL